LRSGITAKANSETFMTAADLETLLIQEKPE